MNNVMQAVSGVAALKGTFIEELFEAMQNGQAHDDTEQAESGEKVVGEMNEMEKALNFLRNKYGETEKRIISRLRGEAEPYSPEEKTRLIVELDSCRSRFQVANKLMWENIETRLAEQKSELSTGWGIRANHQIVLMFGDNGRNPLGDLLGLALMGRMMRD